MIASFCQGAVLMCSVCREEGTEPLTLSVQYGGYGAEQTSSDCSVFPRNKGAE